LFGLGYLFEKNTLCFISSIVIQQLFPLNPQGSGSVRGHQRSRVVAERTANRKPFAGTHFNARIQVSEVHVWISCAWRTPPREHAANRQQAHLGKMLSDHCRLKRASEKCVWASNSWFHICLQRLSWPQSRPLCC